MDLRRTLQQSRYASGFGRGCGARTVNRNYCGARQEGRLRPLGGVQSGSLSQDDPDIPLLEDEPVSNKLLKEEEVERPLSERPLSPAAVARRHFRPLFPERSRPDRFGVDAHPPDVRVPVVRTPEERSASPELTTDTDDAASDDYLGPRLKPGDLVKLTGLKKTNLNGKIARVLPMRDLPPKKVAVRIEGKELLVKRQKIVRVDTDPEVPGMPLNRRPQPSLEDLDEDDVPHDGTPDTLQSGWGNVSAIPYEHSAEEDHHVSPSNEEEVLPRGQVTHINSPHGIQLLPIQEGSMKVERYVFEDDEMPPLEVVETDAKDGSPNRLYDEDTPFQDGDSVMLKGMSDDSLNRLQGVLLSPSQTANDEEGLRVKLANGDTVDVGLENLVRVEALDKDDDDDMPPVMLWPQEDDRWLAGDEASSFGLQGPTIGHEYSTADESAPQLNLDWLDSGATPAPILTPSTREHRRDALWHTPEQLSTDERVHESFVAEAPQQPDLQDEDDDMPPLEPRRPIGASATPSQPESQFSDEDEMPPLEPNRQKPASPRHTESLPSDEEDDNMPPLDPRHTISSSRLVYASAAEDEDHEEEEEDEAEEDDDMPPLVPKQRLTVSTPPVETEPSDEDDEDGGMPPLTPLPRQRQRSRPAEAAEEVEDEEGQQEAEEEEEDEEKEDEGQQEEEEEDDDDDEDDMPPLLSKRPDLDGEEHNSSKHVVQEDTPPLMQKRPDPDGDKHQYAKQVGGVEDMEMPPQLQKRSDQDGDRHHRAKQVDAEEDDMPPLLAKRPELDKSEQKRARLVVENEDDMPPLVPKRPNLDRKERHLSGTEEDEDMPPIANGDGREPQHQRAEQEMEEERQSSLEPRDSDSEAEACTTAPMPMGKRPYRSLEDLDEDDDMPPLENVWLRSAETRHTNDPAANEEADEDEDDDDEDAMPPLEPRQEYPNPARRQGLEQQDQDVSAASESATESTGSMPPLDSHMPQEGAGDPVASQEHRGEEEDEEDDDDDEMPDLLQPSAPRILAGGSVVPAHSGSDRGEPGVPAALAPDLEEEEEEQERDEDSEDSMPPLEALGRTSQDNEEAHEREDVTEEEDDDDDALPPLQPTAVQMAEQVPRRGDGPASVGESESDSDSESGDSMPPLDEGSLRTRPSVPPAAAGQTVSIGEAEAEAEAEAEVKADEDPEVREVGIDGRPEGTTATKPGEESVFPFKEGRRVYISGMPKIGGQFAKVMSLKGLKPTDRIPVELEETGQTVGVLADFLEVASEDGVDSDDSMPPLEPVGGLGASQRMFAAKPVPQQSSDSEVLRPEDLVILMNLKKGELNGEIGQVVRMQLPTSRDEQLRVQLKLLYTGKMLSIKRTHVRLMTDEEMRRGRVAEAGDPIDSDSRRARRCSLLNLGDRVRLMGLTRAEFNGQPGVVVPDLEKAKKGRVTVKLTNSGRVLAVNHDKVEKIAEEPGSDDSVPPLQIVGKPKQAPIASMGQTSKFLVGQPCILQAMSKQWASYNGQVVTVLPHDSDKYLSGQVAVQLETGRRLVVKEKHLAGPPGATVEEMHVAIRGWKLLRKLAEAQDSHDQNLIVEVLAEVDENQDIQWTKEDRLEKRKIVKKLRKWLREESSRPPRQGGKPKPKPKPGRKETEARPRAASPAASTPPAAPGASTKRSTQGRQAQRRRGGAEVQGGTLSDADKSWVVLEEDHSLPDDAGPEPVLVESRLPTAAPASRLKHEEPRTVPTQTRTQGPEQAKSELSKWCEENDLPESLVERLRADEVTDVSELAAVKEEDLFALSRDLKVGAKGRFLTAVRNKREALRSEPNSSAAHWPG